MGEMHLIFSTCLNNGFSSSFLQLLGHNQLPKYQGGLHLQLCYLES